MDPRIHDALTRCIHAINLDNAFGYHPDDAQKAQLDALGVEIQPLIEALALEPYAGKGLGCGCLGHHGFRSSWADTMWRLRGNCSGHVLTWTNRVEVLFDTAGLGAQEMLDWTLQVEDDISFCTSPPTSRSKAIWHVSSRRSRRACVPTWRTVPTACC
jgi:hypothetical protein